MRRSRLAFILFAVHLLPSCLIEPEYQPPDGRVEHVQTTVECCRVLYETGREIGACVADAVRRRGPCAPAESVTDGSATDPDAASSDAGQLTDSQEPQGDAGCADADVSGSCTCVFGCSVPCEEIVELSAGVTQTCARSPSGAVACWGSRLPTEQTDSRYPRRIEGIGQALEVSVGIFTICVREVGGRVMCWGTNRGFAPGLDTDAMGRFIPTPVANVSDATGISVGQLPGCALVTSGQVTCWGEDPRTYEVSFPTLVEGVQDAVEVSAGGGHACARLRSGQVVCWGLNSRGQLGAGDGTPVYVRDPVAVLGLSDAVEVSAGAGHTCARRASGEVVCWGDNVFGQLGRAGDAAWAPISIAGVANAVQLDTGGQHSCVRLSSRRTMCWGSPLEGRLGNGGATTGPEPVFISAIDDADELTVGDYHACVHRPAGTVYCWGGNPYGQFGALSGNSFAAPTQIPLVPPAHCENGTKDTLESDVGCGGPCASCAAGAACSAFSDCMTNYCTRARCAVPLAPHCMGLPDGTPCWPAPPDR